VSSEQDRLFDGDTPDPGLNPEMFEPGDESLAVERSEGSGMLLSLRFDPEETDAILARASFEDLGVVAYGKRCILEHARMYSWTKTLPQPWSSAGPNWTYGQGH